MTGKMANKVVAEATKRRFNFGNGKIFLDFSNRFYGQGKRPLDIDAQDAELLLDTREFLEETAELAGLVLKFSQEGKQLQVTVRHSELKKSCEGLYELLKIKAAREFSKDFADYEDKVSNRLEEASRVARDICRTLNSLEQEFETDFGVTFSAAIESYARVLRKDLNSADLGVTVQPFVHRLKVFSQWLVDQGTLDALVNPIRKRLSIKSSPLQPEKWRFVGSAINAPRAHPYVTAAIVAGFGFTTATGFLGTLLSRVPPLIAGIFGPLQSVVFSLLTAALFYIAICYRIGIRSDRQFDEKLLVFKDRIRHLLYVGKKSIAAGVVGEAVENSDQLFGVFPRLNGDDSSPVSFSDSTRILNEKLSFNGSGTFGRGIAAVISSVLLGVLLYLAFFAPDWLHHKNKLRHASFYMATPGRELCLLASGDVRDEGETYTVIAVKKQTEETVTTDKKQAETVEISLAKSVV